MRPFVFLCVFIGFYASLWLLMGPYLDSSVHMDSHGSLCIIIVPYAFLLVFLGPFRFFCIHMDSTGSSRVLISS